MIEQSFGYVPDYYPFEYKAKAFSQHHFNFMRKFVLCNFDSKLISGKYVRAFLQYFLDCEARLKAFNCSI